MPVAASVGAPDPRRRRAACRAAQHVDEAAGAQVGAEQRAEHRQIGIVDLAVRADRSASTWPPNTSCVRLWKSGLRLALVDEHRLDPRLAAAGEAGQRRRACRSPDRRRRGRSAASASTDRSWRRRSWRVRARPAAGTASDTPPAWRPRVPLRPGRGWSSAFRNWMSLRSASKGPIERLNVASVPPPPRVPTSDRTMTKLRSTPSRISVACA